MHPIAEEKYVRLTTYTKDGRAKPSPVWIADLGDGRVGFTTGDHTWKFKRMRNTPSVELVASNSRGVPKEGAESVQGTAAIAEGDEFEPVRAAIKAKYGLQVTMVQTLAKFMTLIGRGHGEPRGIIITVDA